MPASCTSNAGFRFPTLGCTTSLPFPFVVSRLLLFIPFRLYSSAHDLFDLLSHLHAVLVWALLVAAPVNCTALLRFLNSCCISSQRCPMRSELLSGAAPPHIKCKDQSALSLSQEEKGIDRLWPQEGGGSSSGSESEFMGNLERKILKSDALNLPHLNAPIKLHDLVLSTLEDLQKTYEKSKTRTRLSNDGRESSFEELQKLYKVQKFVKNLWAKQPWESENVTVEYEGDVEHLQFQKIGEVVTERLDCTDTKHNEAFAKNSNGESEPNDHQTNLHDFGTLMSPNSVLSESRALNSNFKGSQNITYSPPLLQPVQLQAIGKLKSVDRKRLSLSLVPVVLDHNLNTTSQTEKEADDIELGALDTCMISEPIPHVEIQNGHCDGSQTSEDIESPHSSPGSSPKFLPYMPKPSTPGTRQPTSTEHLTPAINTNRNEDDGIMGSKSSVLDSPTLPILRLRTQLLPPTPAPPPSPMVVTGIPVFTPPSSPTVLTGTPLLFGSPRLSTQEMEPFACAMAIDDINHVSEPSETPSSASPLPPSMLNAPKTEISVSLPIYMPLNEEHRPNTAPSTRQLSFSPSPLSKFASPSPPPSPTKGSTLPASPPSSPSPPSVGRSSMMGSRAPPPPPPLGGAAKSLCVKITGTKLKRSTQMGNLYRVLKGKVEGSTLDGKASSGRKNKPGHSSGGNKAQGMADALAEMTKRQIEEDVENHSASILELRSSLNSFDAKDVKELLKFHQDMEQILENLTDETQVLARFEGFPSKKLETIRMAVALYKKLEVIVTTLKDWKLASPIRHQLDKVENYFNKIKEEVDVIERSKEEEIKRFKAHKIGFDFSALKRIKEAMVDLSSDCIEIVLKESQETREMARKTPSKSKELSKLLWRAFQMAFRVYNFAGGQDDRADRLTNELAHEIETTYPQF